MKTKTGILVDLDDDHIGQWVTYKAYNENERGKIKSFNNKTRTAFVVYKCNENWDADHWKDYTAQATNYSDLSF